MIRVRRWILAGAALLVVAVLGYAVSVERQRRRLAIEYQQARQLVSQLEVERTQLNEELVGARQTMAVHSDDLQRLQEELKAVQGRLDDTVAQLASLERDNTQLHQASLSLTTQLAAVTIEKQQLQAKLSSLHELRAAIRDLRRKIAREREASRQAHLFAFREADQQRLLAGNRGYVVRDGLSTIGSGSRLRVHVLEPEIR